LAIIAYYHKFPPVADGFGHKKKPAPRGTGFAEQCGGAGRTRQEFTSCI
jgi:hypothetical protein